MRSSVLAFALGLICLTIAIAASQEGGPEVVLDLGSAGPKVILSGKSTIKPDDVKILEDVWFDND